MNIRNNDILFPHHCAPKDVSALIARLDALADPEQQAMPTFEDTDWRTMAGVCARVIKYLSGRNPYLQTPPTARGTNTMTAADQNHEETVRCLVLGSDAPECAHDGITPAFDEDAAKGLSAREVRKRWPRFEGQCPACRQHVVAYASWAHYIYGDY